MDILKNKQEVEEITESEYLSSEDFDFEYKTNSKNKFEYFLESKYFFAVLLVFVSITSFSLGGVYVLNADKPALKIYNTSVTSGEGEIKGEVNGVQSVQNLDVKSGTDIVQGNNQNNNVLSEKIVGSKNGSKYHYEWCPGAKQISEKNKITFNSIQEARDSGYTPAANCKGLK